MESIWFSERRGWQIALLIICVFLSPVPRVTLVFSVLYLIGTAWFYLGDSLPFELSLRRVLLGLSVFHVLAALVA